MHRSAATSCGVDRWLDGQLRGRFQELTGGEFEALIVPISSSSTPNAAPLMGMRHSCPLAGLRDKHHTACCHETRRVFDSPLFLPSIPDRTSQDALAVAIVATPTTSRVSLRTAPPFALEPPSRPTQGRLAQPRCSRRRRLRTAALLIASLIACNVVPMVEGGIPSAAPAACPERAHRISLLTSTQSRCPVGRLCRHRRSDSRNEIAIKDHIIDRVVLFCGLRDEGKIKGLIHLRRI